MRGPAAWSDREHPYIYDRQVSDMGEVDPGENVQLIAYADRFGGSLAGLH